MLFLMNDQITEIDIPEMHLAKCWKTLGCGDPYGMRAREALAFATRVVAEHVKEGIRLEDSLLQDLGSLIISKTGANAALFPAFDGKVSEPRLTILPETILASLRERHHREGKAPDMGEIWPAAA
ncbi:hypothetical protein HY29_04310 [Hyphomonas beringensis]|uniref:Uncharacterized protein n=1 Tax=Hyphomonas beringensis TaxID=1280946 RepID=A0A062U797_9PROT|nr:hypothetical protein [Hyphomonas beringensis]KCZ52514.1 hypothetical protein HY29_04310 [Hyphomonas beringensis]